MILDRDRKIIILRVPKIGSSTLSYIFSHHQKKLLVRGYEHALPSRVSTLIYPEMLTDYDVYAFYRDPYLRFVSAWCYLKIQYKKMQERNLINLKDVRLLKRTNNICYRNVTPELIDSISIEDVVTLLHEGRKFYISGLFRYQHMFHTANTKLLDFVNFNSNIVMLLSKLNMSVEKTIPIINSTNSASILDSITPKEKKMIIDFQKPEYAYFNDRDIHFSSFYL